MIKGRVPFLVALLLICSMVVIAQRPQYKMGTNVNSGFRNQVLLELEDTSQALLLTRVKRSPNLVFGANAYRGMLVFDSTVNQLAYYDGTAWKYPITSLSASQNIYNSDDALTGNRIVTMNTNNLTFSSTTGNFIFNPTSTGNVGIGISTPSEKLDINGNIGFSPSATAQSYVIYPQKTTTNVQGSSLTISGGQANNAGASAQVGGNVIVKGGDGYASGNASPGQVYIYGGQTRGTANTVVNIQRGNIILAHDGTNASGNVGIGTNNPISRLQVSGAVRTDSLVLNSLTAGAAGDSILTINTTTGVVRRIAPSTIKPSIDTSIYSFDGTLKGNRIVTMAGNNLSFNSVNGNLVYNPSGTGAMLVGMSSAISIPSATGETAKLHIGGNIMLGNSGNTTNTTYAMNFVNGNRLWQISARATNGDNGGLNIYYNGQNVSWRTLLKLDTTGNIAMPSLVTGGNVNTDNVLVVDAAGNVKKAGTISNIYTADGTLAGNRAVTMGGNNLSFNSVNGNFIFNPTGTGKVGIGTNTPISRLEVSGAMRADSLSLVSLLNKNTMTTRDSLLMIDSVGVVKKVSASTVTTSAGSVASITAGTLNTTKNSNGITISPNTGAVIVRLQEADATNPGLVSTGVQTFAGSKTIQSATNPLSLLGVQTGTLSDSILTIASGVVKKVLPTSLFTFNIYNKDSSLTGNRTVNKLGNWLRFIGNTTGDTVMFSSTGSVGIGISNPAQKLDVNGKAQFRDDIYTTKPSSFILGGSLYFRQQSVFFDSTVTANKLTLLTLSNASAINDSLLMISTTGVVKKAGVSSAVNTIYSNNDSLTGNRTISKRANYSLQFVGTTVANKDTVMFANTGNVGIGTSAPKYKLDVKGLISGDTIVTKGIKLVDAVGNFNGYGMSGNWGITTVSDSNLKENIKPYSGPNALKGINSINIVEYDWKASKVGDPNRHMPIGVIAQNVQKVFPDAVQFDSQSGNLTLRSMLFSFYLMKATQELSKEVDGLKKENQELKQRIDKLEQMFNRLMTNQKK